MQALCSLTEIPDGEARAFPYRDRSLVLVRRGLKAWAYVNRCPHAGVELQWQENRFMSLDGTQLQCSTHGALFNIDSGYCTWGPCQGRSLQSLSISIENGIVYLME
ncbi:Rieske (2Fe-2S) protein [Permianibacter aggregans]|uniref:Nitrite reductase/ring-hydroxylating ferredoxin subunit n=1 Tax=Permianibacter aggregans TaxID=1510150 RepID=A0A4R6UJ59_9GAMM|nr:Rieske (2Fe-2S) protein [Permianibacter aggregans]QGX40652.1 Rieske (2Fe-2S) protein [Permianibacter aggregans]TDQ46522.1 nitrite reductase/ring-hydroxylating ferredoxin subunit [Permianibacter aggregans]